MELWGSNGALEEAASPGRIYPSGRPAGSEAYMEKEESCMGTLKRQEHPIRVLKGGKFHLCMSN